MGKTLRRAQQPCCLEVAVLKVMCCSQGKIKRKFMEKQPWVSICHFPSHKGGNTWKLDLKGMKGSVFKRSGEEIVGCWQGWRVLVLGADGYKWLWFSTSNWPCMCLDLVSAWLWTRRGGQYFLKIWPASEWAATNTCSFCQSAISVAPFRNAAPRGWAGSVSSVIYSSPGLKLKQALVNM